MKLSTKKKLTRADRKQIEAAIARAKKQGDKKKQSAQDSIPFQRMFQDGICRVNDNFYSKTIQFQDINYQLSQPEDQSAVFDGWCDFLNYFDPSIRCQITCFDASATKESFAQNIIIPGKGDDFDDIRREYTEMLQNQQAKGNNGLIKVKYLTFGIEADNLRMAKPRLERIETDILNNFKQLGVAAEVLDGYERLHLLYDIFHMDDQTPFRFSWDWLVPSGLSVKDFIAPSSFEFAKGNTFGMGRKIGAVSYLQILAPEMNDRIIKEFLDMESSLILTMHIRSIDQMKAIKTIKRKITDLDKMKIEMAFIPEGDVYRLIIGSKLPSAERFEHWVFDEVLPCIRKHGAYMTDSFAEKVASDPNVAFVLAEQLLREHEERKRLSAELEKALPKAEYVDAFITPGNCTNIRTTAKELGVPERWFCRFLIEVKFAYRMQPYGNLLPYARPETSGFFVVKDYTRNGHFGSYMLITPEGKNHLRRLIFTESAVAAE